MTSIFLWVSVCTPCLLPANPENLVFRELTARGLPAGEQRFKLPPPGMADGLTSQGQRRVIEAVGGPRRRVEYLLRDSIVAPLVLKIGEVRRGADGAAPLRRVDVSFVAYGPLESFARADFINSLIEVAADKSGSRTTVLEGSELATRGLKAVSSKQRKEFFIHSRIELLDRVALRTTRRVEVTVGQESVFIAAILDHRFHNDARYPNQWRSIKNKTGNQAELGSPRTYETSGSYIKITRLKEPPGSLFIEQHYLYAEPRGWFGGKNFLRSKLPLAVQRSVRDLRRRLQGERKAAERRPR